LLCGTHADHARHFTVLKHTGMCIRCVRSQLLYRANTMRIGKGRRRFVLYLIKRRTWRRRGTR
jgi:hypothetical protein